MLVLYWIPETNSPTPRLMCFDGTGRKYQVNGTRVEGNKKALKFTFPDNTKNRERYDFTSSPWHKELPVEKVNRPTKTEKKKESPFKGDSLKAPLTREELLLMLDNNGIVFKKNQKTETLFEKLPDDIARNFQLVESVSEV